MKRVTWVRLLLALVSLAVALGGAELVLRSTMESPLPARQGRFWEAGHEAFGVWHPPNVTKRHRKRCFVARYHTNSVGARDRERTLTADAPRTLVLGDSFIEGWGLPDAERLSNLLEEATGREHLNFGMSHFSPYQSYLVYRDLASTYDHDTVIIGVTPENDFLDLSLRRSRLKEGYEYIYRPYLVPQDGGYEEVVLRENALQRALRRHSYLYHAARDLVAPRPPPRVAPVASGVVRSGFHDHDEDELGVLRRSLELLIEAAGPRRVIVVLIPVHKDFLRFETDGPGRLAGELASLEELGDVSIVDLLPVMAGETDDPTTYFFRCDYHWDADGNAAAARALANR